MSGFRQPSGFIVILPVWGESFIRMLSTYGLPSLLSPRNLPAMAKRLPLKVFLITKEQDRSSLEAMPALAELSSYATTRVLVPPPGHARVDSQYGYFSSCYRHGIEVAQLEGAAAVLLTADQVWADGAMEAIARRIMDGYRVVLAAAPRVLEDSMLRSLDALRGDDGFGERLDAQTLVQLALSNMHPWDRSLFWDEQDRGRPASFLYWHVEGQGYLAHCLHLLPVCVRTDGIGDIQFTHTIDGGDFVERVASGTQDCYVVQQSDEVMYIGTAPAEQSAHLLDYPKGDWKTYSNWCLSMGVSRLNLFFLRHGVRFTTGDVKPEAWSEIERKAGAICERICRQVDKPHLLFYSRVYFVLNHYVGDMLRKNRFVVRTVKMFLRLVGLGY